MQSRFKAAALFAAVAGLSLLVAGCGQYKMLQARRTVKEAHLLYQQQEYKRAAERYEETISLDPDQTQAYFFLANSYDQLYKPSRKGDPTNDGYLTKAVEYYQKASELDKDTKMRKLALEYLVNAYGADKLNDPAQAEPLVKRMIALEPKEPTNYYVLAKMYEDSGQYELAEQTLLEAKQVRPDDSGVLLQLAAYYNRLGEFDKTMEYLNARAAMEPNNPEAFYTNSMYFWEKAFRDSRLKDVEKMSYIKLGIEAANKALQLKPDYADAYTSKNLLLRSQALLEKDPARQQALIKEAEQLSARGTELRKKKAAGV